MDLAPLLNRDSDGNLPSTPPFSRRFRDRGELIDHISASHRLANPDNLRRVVTITAGGVLPSISERPQLPPLRSPGARSVAAVG